MKGAVVGAAAVALTLPLMAIGGVVLIAADENTATAAEGGSGGLNADALPKRAKPYATWITKSSQQCSGLSPGLLAAQLMQESNFNADAVGPETQYGQAVGIAQFLPSTYASYGEDSDRDGKTGPTDPEDAIMAQGKYMCSLLKRAEKSRYSGGPVKLALAGYNAGWGKVEKYSGIPPYEETTHYVDAILRMEKEFTASLSSGDVVAPVDAPVSAPYRTPGSQWESGYHTGMDFPVATGTPVRSIAQGKIVTAGWGGPYGRQVIIKHKDGKFSHYAHLSKLTVSQGDTVESGQQIGSSGSSGTNSTGPHLHFEIRTGPEYGTDIDPMAYLRKHGVKI